MVNGEIAEVAIEEKRIKRRDGQMDSIHNYRD